MRSCVTGLPPACLWAPVLHPEATKAPAVAASSQVAGMFFHKSVREKFRCLLLDTIHFSLSCRSLFELWSASFCFQNSLPTSSCLLTFCFASGCVVALCCGIIRLCCTPPIHASARWSANTLPLQRPSALPYCWNKPSSASVRQPCAVSKQ